MANKFIKEELVLPKCYICSDDDVEYDGYGPIGAIIGIVLAINTGVSYFKKGGVVDQAKPEDKFSEVCCGIGLMAISIAAGICL